MLTHREMAAAIVAERAPDYGGGLSIGFADLPITRVEWQPSVNANPIACDELLEHWPATDYLDDLYREIGGSVDLWMGHSALDGTRWVWPRFMEFVERHSIDEWMLTPNLSPRGHLYLDGAFRKNSNPRFPLFGPEKAR